MDATTCVVAVVGFVSSCTGTTTTGGDFAADAELPTAMSVVAFFKAKAGMKAAAATTKGEVIGSSSFGSSFAVAHFFAILWVVEYVKRVAAVLVMLAKAC